MTTSASPANLNDGYEIPRARLIDRLRNDFRIHDERVLAAIGSVPRHAFVPDALKAQSYKDNALPIAGGQTISQPFIVAKMTELLGLAGKEKVLEIGAGTGYQTAVLSRLSRAVFAVERLPLLAAEAKDRLKSLHFHNVSIKCDDGTNGWEMYAPFDAILVAAGSPYVPEPLLKQLTVGGRLVIPIGDEQKTQVLIRITRNTNGYAREDFGPCSFVPLIGEHGWK